MEVNKHFMQMLTAIDFHVGHLPKDLWVNEERVPELQPVFELLVHKLSPETNCVTPKQLALYSSLLSKHDHFAYLDKVSKAIDQFYDENTRAEKICSSDIEELEKKILNSQHELKTLKTSGDSYRIKQRVVNDEISLLEKEQNKINYSSFKIQENLISVLKIFMDEAETFEIYFNKLHNNVISSLKNDDICFTKLVSTNIIKLTEAWRKQILSLINNWFGPNKKSSDISDVFSNQIHKLSVVSQNVTELRMREIKERCEIKKINMALNDIFSIKNDFDKTRDNTYLNGVALKKYIITKFMKKRVVTLDADLHMTTAESNNLQQRTSNLVIIDAQRKILDLKAIKNRIRFVHDSMEHYIMSCDVVWCLMRTGCSMVNLKCELALHCESVLQIIFDDIKRSEEWIINYEEEDNAKRSTSAQTRVVKFEGYECFSKAYENCDEMNKLCMIVHQMKRKFGYDKNKNKETLLVEEQLQQLTVALKFLHEKFPNLSL